MAHLEFQEGRGCTPPSKSLIVHLYRYIECTVYRPIYEFANFSVSSFKGGNRGTMAPKHASARKVQKLMVQRYARTCVLCE